MLLNNIRDKSRNVRLPKQDTLPSADQLRTIYNDAMRNPGKTIELPFGQSCLLTISRKATGGTCSWMLNVWQGTTSSVEFEHDSNDPRWIQQQLSEYFPKYSHNRVR
ncbi:MAG TPA: hypothetical protein V6C97_06490 [Oculatellaceae cyanobacterium]